MKKLKPDWPALFAAFPWAERAFLANSELTLKDIDRRYLKMRKSSKKQKVPRKRKLTPRQQ